MSSADKTREMLLNTMVKSKAGAQPSEAASQEKKAAPAAQTSKSVVRKKAATKRAPVKKQSAGKSSVRTAPASDPFQSKGRVWPD